MSVDQIPDLGAQHLEAVTGAAFNSGIGHGLADLLEDIIGRQPGVRTVCDLGCGNGHLAGRLGRRGLTVVGIDASPAYLDIARRHHGSDRVTFAQGLIGEQLCEQLRVHQPPFDLVVSSDVIEHLYDPLQLIATAFGVLRPGGIAVIGTPYHGYMKNVAISALGKWDVHHSVHWLGGHIKFFSVNSLRRMMQQTGFNEPQFHYYGRWPGFWKNMVAVATRPDTVARA
jgi:2-polyprenyl-6-hydroxyphenyl methylase/3-demethylubiquinone-9 3-methyltransferase